MAEAPQSIILQQGKGKGSNEENYDAKVAENSTSNQSPSLSGEVPYSVFTSKQKRGIVLVASTAAFFSPVSASIYFPAIEAVAKDLNVSLSDVNLTITTYMIFQGLAPSFMSYLTNVLGRRPSYIICLVIYTTANIGLALQRNYVALLILRCIQSSGSSATVLLASAVVADISTTSERGKYNGFAAAPAMFGSAFGPIIGGILSQTLGWNSIFWFLAIIATLILVPLLLFFPETSRQIVGDGSVPPQRWNVPLWNYLRRKPKADSSRHAPDLESRSHINTSNVQRPNPLAALSLVFEKEMFILLVFAGLVYSAYYIIMSATTPQYSRIYGLNDLKIGLCFMPMGVGGACASVTIGRLVDWNFRRHASRLGYTISSRYQPDLKDLPIEKARLQVVLPLVYVGSTAIIIYGCIIDHKPNLSGPLILSFFIAYCMSGCFQVLSTLIVDLNPKNPSLAIAAGNLFRCLMGAGATAFTVPMIDSMGSSWAYTLVGIILITASAMIWLVIHNGPGWRERKLAISILSS